jgi:hypothetical protein
MTKDVRLWHTTPEIWGKFKPLARQKRKNLLKPKNDYGKNFVPSSYQDINSGDNMP